MAFADFSEDRRSAGKKAADDKTETTIRQKRRHVSGARRHAPRSPNLACPYSAWKVCSPMCHIVKSWRSCSDARTTKHKGSMKPSSAFLYDKSLSGV
eukprot:4744175-Amphidinium_carterae.1